MTLASTLDQSLGPFEGPSLSQNNFELSTFNGTSNSDCISEMAPHQQGQGQRPKQKGSGLALLTGLAGPGLPDHQRRQLPVRYVGPHNGPRMGPSHREYPGLPTQAPQQSRHLGIARVMPHGTHPAVSWGGSLLSGKGVCCNRDCDQKD